LKHHLSSMRITRIHFDETVAFSKYARFVAKKIALSINLRKHFVFLVKISISLVSMYSAFFSYQYYVYTKFCILTQEEKDAIYIPDELVKYAHKQNYHLINSPNATPVWCNKTLPFSYTAVQSTYWNVGFLSYWHWKQVPNFLLAFPIIYVCFTALKTYFLSLNPKHAFNMLGLISLDEPNNKNTCENHIDSRFGNNMNLFPFALHLVALLVSSLFFMHVQVICLLLL